MTATYKPEPEDENIVSVARSGEGTENPENISNYRITAGGTHTGLIIRWSGNGYNRDTCWIRAHVDDIIELDTNI